MKKLTKVSLGVAAAVATITAGAGVVSAWGPARASFTMEKPANYVTFNSITNNVIGDEHYFVSASEYTGDASKNHYVDGIQVEEGKEYVVRMYVHNNAASNLGLVAKDVRAYVILPTDTASEITVSGKIYSSNANPKTVWDETTFKSKNGKKFSLAYIDGTAKYYNIDKNGKTRAFSLDELNDGNDLFTSKGHLLGFDQMDGNIPGCNEYSGYLTFHVTPKFEQEAKPELEIQKEVKIRGSSAAYSEQVTAKAGDTVRYRIHVKNIGNAVVNNLVVRDILPAGLTYVKGSTQLVNNAHKDGITLSDNIVANGINLGSYAAGADAYIYFNATVDQAVAEKCEKSTLHNNAKVSGTEVSTPKEDGADVLVDGKVCNDDPNFTINKMVQVNGGAWAENLTVKAGDTVRYRIQFKNTGNTELKNVAIRDILPANISYVKGSTTVDGKTVGDGIITADGIMIGTVAKGATVTVYFNATVSAALADDCNDSTLTNVVKGKYNNDAKTEKSDTASVSVEGKVCKTPDLPKTGATTIVTGIAGATAVATAAGYYIISRKKLN
ncbi:DUF11 domain-containing protein [Candidatus Saccharibacteria bacterium]|nr:DUF11 domain-containing protein [Candidatus Saccharibacteria bacterium]